MSSRLMHFSAYKPEVFLTKTPFWDWQVNGYPLVMVIINVALAILAMWITYRLVQAFRETKRRYAILTLWGLAWILVIPNAAYVMTDARHIIGYCPIEEYGHVCPDNAWMTLFFFAYGLVGWISFVFCVRPLKRAIEAKRGSGIASLFIVAVTPFVALGVLLGLVNRWNSWEIFSSPGLILRTVAQYGANMLYLKNWFAVSLILYILYWAGDRLLRLLPYERKNL